MKWVLGFACIAALAGCSSQHDGHSGAMTAHQHTTPDAKAGDAHAGHPAAMGDAHAGHNAAMGNARLMVQTKPGQPKAGEKTALTLMLHGDGGAMVKDFEVVHEQKLHLIVVRDGLDQFAHIHPAIAADGTMTVEYAFPTGGTYWLFADYKPAGKAAATARAEVRVAGDAPPAPALTPNVPGRVEGDGLRADVSVADAKAGSAARIGFTLKDANDKSITDLHPYMGAMGHLVVISADGKEYVHAHPVEEKATGNTVAFDAHFGKPGVYKGWGQFQRAGKVHAVPFVVNVD